MGKPAARQGDMTAHGGSIVVGFPTVLIGGMPAARVGDMHTCPMQTPAPVPVPHVGGPILPPGVPTVLIGGLPAACVGDMATCVGPPDSILPPGCPTVLIGAGGGGGGGGGGGMSSGGGGSVEAGAAAGDANVVALEGESEEHYLDVKFTDKGGRPITGLNYHLEGPGGVDEDGPLTGRVRKAGVASGSYTIELRAITEAKWSQASARDGETVQMQVSLDGIEDGTSAVFEIFARNPNSPDEEVRTIEDAEVSGGSLEVDWAYEYIDEDQADGDTVTQSSDSEASASQTDSSDASTTESESSDGEVTQSESSEGNTATQSAAEADEEDTQQRRRFYSPSFFFKVRVMGCEAQSPMLQYRDFVELYLKNDDEEAIGDAQYRVFLSNGEVRTGQLDGNGYAKIENVPPGRWSAEFPEHGSLEEI